MSQALVVDLAHRPDALPVRTRRRGRAHTFIFGAIAHQLDLAGQQAQLAKVADAGLGRETGCKC